MDGTSELVFAAAGTFSAATIKSALAARDAEKNALNAQGSTLEIERKGGEVQNSKPQREMESDMTKKHVSTSSNQRKGKLPKEQPVGVRRSIHSVRSSIVTSEDEIVEVLSLEIVVQCCITDLFAFSW